jgi:Ca2+:H+ antiporter
MGLMAMTTAVRSNRASMAFRLMAAWVWLVPIVALVILLVAVSTDVGASLAMLCGASLIGGVIAAVHHAEVVAHRVGEPFGTLILAVAVTVIEASLILSMMFTDSGDRAVLPRDTIFAALMIICNGVVGVCILLGSLAHREQTFRIEGVGAGLGALIVMSTLTLLLPIFAASGLPGSYGRAELGFIAATSAALWAAFVFAQTVRHRDYFLPVTGAAAPDEHATPPTIREAWASLGWLLVSLVSVIGLAKMLSPTIESAVDATGAPKAVLGIVIAIVILMPETWAAVTAARANRLQTSMNLAIGSAIACIGLTVPAVAVTAVAFDLPLILGLEPMDAALLTLTFIVSAITLGTGRTYLMQGAVHLVIFSTYLFFALAS